MIHKNVRRLLLTSLLLPLAIGWRAASAPADDALRRPISMTLAGERLYVSDELSGLHVYDVTDPAAPRAVITVPLAGNRGSAAKGDVVYANTHYKVLALRVGEDGYEVLAEIQPTYGTWEGGTRKFKGGFQDPSNGFGCGCAESQMQPLESPATFGGSSYAVFAVIDDYLYHVDDASLVTYDVSTPEAPKEIGRTALGWSIETLHPAGDLLFVGGTRGMYVCDRSHPAKPRLIGLVQHFHACDPVVVSGSTAYVTLRGSNGCGGDRDALLCVDIAEPRNPTVISEKSVATPFGLTVSGDRLYVSTGQNGYALFDVSQPKTPVPLATWPDWPTHDFIWSGDTLYVLGIDDVRIFDVSDPENPVLLGAIEEGTS